MARLLTIMGVKDGVGASPFALEMAERLRTQGQRVLLVDWNESYLDLYLKGENPKPWRTLREIEKIPRPIQKEWLDGFLKGPGDIPCLALAKERSELISINPSWAFSQLKLLGTNFDWMIINAGSRWNRFNIPILSMSDLLLFVLGADIALIEELKRKLDELLQSFFPLKRVGWVGRNWDRNSFLTLKAVEESLPIRFFVGNFDVPALNGDLAGFMGEKLFGSDQRLGTRDQGPTAFQVSDLGSLISSPLLKTIQQQMEEQGLKSTEPDLRPKVSKIIREVLEEKSELLPPGSDRNHLIETLLDELLGFGALEPLLQNHAYTEILVNGLQPIYVEENGKLKETALKFSSLASLQKTIEKILLPVGRRVDESSPMVDCRLLDGSRVNIIIPPLALEGPVISIRRFGDKSLLPEDLIRLGAADSLMMECLKEAVQKKKNILVSGGTGSGKTTLLNVLSSFIPPEERIVTIEDAAELRLNQPHVVRLESRPRNIEGKGEITIRDLVRNALRMRPDRIIVGECRGGEALDMLQAMNTGHDGSLTTIHANSPRDALSRLETLVMFAGMELPSQVIRDQIASAIDVVVQVARLSDGKRKIISITNVDEN